MKSPERIHNWQNTELSPARIYGCARTLGYYYFVAWDEPGQPLVRGDILSNEAPAKRKAAKLAQQQEINERQLIFL